MWKNYRHYPRGESPTRHQNSENQDSSIKAQQMETLVHDWREILKELNISEQDFSKIVNKFKNNPKIANNFPVLRVSVAHELTEIAKNNLQKTVGRELTDEELKKIEFEIMLKLKFFK